MDIATFVGYADDKQKYKDGYCTDISGWLKRMNNY